ncbi:MAG: NAD(P)-binding protein [Bacteroidales bacterium]|nr:NAD(P)-binding protein [Bacteroidales bacterium]
MYDIVIVGSGLGGLLCGYLLSKEGKKVLVLEKNHQLGGCLQSFTRQNCVFDTGMHYVGSMNEGQILWRFFKYFDLLGKVKLRKLDEDVFDLIHIAGDEYKYAQGYDNFISTMLQYFPDEENGLNKYINKFKEIRSAISSFIGESDDEQNMPTMKYFEENAFDFIKSVTSNPRLQDVLAATNPLYFGTSEKTPLYVHAVINNSLLESAWRFVDGGGQIADALAQSIKSQGGDVRKNANVNRFVMNNSDTLVEAVELDNGERIFGHQFISNIHPVKTFEIIDSKLIRKAYLKRINNIEQTMSVFSMYIVLKENSFKYFNYNYYHFENPNVWGADIYSKYKWPSGYMLYTPASSNTGTYAESVNVITYMSYEELKQWDNTTIEKRGQSYKDFKTQKAELLLDLIEKRFPGFRTHIKKYYTSTPLTYRDYTSTLNGSVYGNMRDCNNALKTMVSPKTRIPNLYLTGQNINLHGVLGVSMGAFITCAQFLGTRYIYDKLNNMK